ncbi:MAG TPA: hypothetical protein VHN77_16085 [Phycisphaerales bacterium]|nr:hypothetical protein [Phycisphaerales bacterium]
MRRALIDEMAHLAPIEAHLWWIVRGTPHLLEEDDFLWLLERATDAGYTDSARHHYADLARTLFHPYRLDKLEAWYAVRDTEPVRTMMNYPVVMEVNSNVADRARRDWETLRESEQIPQHEPITPPPNERIQELLTLCETKDVRYFHRLCREMTLDENSTHYGVERALISTPGWLNGSATTRQRVVNAAKRFLESDVESIDAAVKEPLNCVLTAGMAAIWLIADTEPANGPLPVAPMKSWWNRLLRRFTSSGSKQSTQDVVPTLGWLASRDVTWWSRWSWYILRELHPNMSGEAQETKARLLTMLRVNAGESVRTHVLENATSTKECAAALLQSLLPMLEADADPLLDDGLATLIQQGSVPADRLQAVASFVLRSADVSVSQLCLARMKATVDVLSDSSDVIREAEVLAVALLTQGDWATWDQVVAELKSRPEFSRRVLAHYAHGERLRFRREDARQSVQTITSARIGAVVALLFEAYPPDRDPTREGAYFAGPDDSARDWRSQLLNGLSERGDEEALAALKSLERNFGSRFPWLRRPRSRAEKVYVGSRWSPIPLGAIARMFGDQATHLLRSPQDVLDGMLAALESYDASLHASTPSPLENFWNVPTGGPPTPKEEERASDLICEVIRQYFRGYALAADREVQVYRRPVRGMPGKPGSEVDVCVTVPASGTVTRDAIAAIVEVKLSKNPGVKTDLRSQLVDRYMVESGADACLYVVAWMTATGMDRRQAPKWSSIQDARTELSQQAENARESQGVPVAAFVMDCSLE